MPFDRLWAGCRFPRELSGGSLEMCSSLMPVNLLLDARKLGDGGIGTYIENLIDGFLELEASAGVRMGLSLLVGTGPHSQQSTQALERWRSSVEIIAEPAAKYSLEEYLVIPWRQRRALGEHFLFHSPHYTLPLFLGIPSIVTIHDVIHVNYPEKRYHPTLATLLIRSAASRADRIITVSDESKRRINEVCPLLDTPVHVVPNALHREIYGRDERTEERCLDQMGLKEPYLLFVGSDRPHKGLRELLSALKCLGDGGKPLVRLVVVGERFSQETQSLIAAEGLNECISFVGSVSSEALSVLYGSSKAVVVPSKEEGFGFPALEAMACKAPVICGPARSLTEVCGDCAWYVEDDSIRSLAQVLRYVLQGGAAVEEKCERGVLRAKKFSRLHSARKTYQIYQALLRGSRRGQRAVFSRRHEIRRNVMPTARGTSAG